MQRRQLSFQTYSEVIDDIERLRAGGYERAGNWSLGQICFHLSYYMRGSLEGFPFKMPWIIRKLIGKRLLRKILEQGGMRAGMQTIPSSRPPKELDEDAAIDEAIEYLRRLEHHEGDLHPSPMFDQLPLDQWQRLHLGHTAHHLSFLVPKSA